MMWFTRVASQASVANALAIALAFYWPPLAAGMPRAALLTALTVAPSTSAASRCDRPSTLINSNATRSDS